MKLQFSGLFNGTSERLAPGGVAFDALNADFQRGDVGPVNALLRWKETPEASANSARGMHYAQYGTAKEILSFVKVGSVVKLKHYNVITDTWTGITANGADALVEDTGGWFFAQYLDKVYCLSKQAGLFVHTVGSTTGDAAWSALDAEFEFGEGFAAEFEGAPYLTRDFKAGDSLGFSSSYSTSWSYGVDLSGNTAYITAGSFSTGSDWDITWTILYGELVQTNLSEYLYIRQDASEAWIGSNFYGDPDPGQAWVTADGTTWTACDLEVKGIDVRANGQSSDIGIRFRIPSSFVNSNGGVIRGVRFKSYYGINAGLRVDIFPVVFGGSDLWDMGATAGFSAPELNYAAAYYNPSTVAWKNPYLFTVAEGVGQGASGGRLTSPLGGRVKITGVKNKTFQDQGFTKIRIYKKHSDTLWYQIGEVDNKPSGITPVYDTYSLSELSTLGITATLPTGGFDIDFIPECLATWKGHLVIGGNGKAYFSRGGKPGRFLPSPEIDFIPPDIQDLEQPRTLYVSQDRSETVSQIVPDDQVFFICDKGNYTMIGDSAYDATKSRSLRGSRPGLGKKSGAVGDQGTLLASTDGLHAQAVTRALSASTEALFQTSELTQTIRDTWKWLTEANPSKTMVSTLWDEIWVVREDRAIRLSGKDVNGSASWSKLALKEIISGTETAVSAFDLKYHPAIGGLIQGTNGAIYRIPTRLDSYGTAGLAWYAQTPWIDSGRATIDAIGVTCEGTITVQIEVDRGAKNVDTKTFTITGPKKFIKNLSLPAGYAFRIKVSGTGTSRFSFADLVMGDAKLGVGG